jgi:hypothetical protein
MNSGDTGRGRSEPAERAESERPDDDPGEGSEPGAGRNGERPDGGTATDGRSGAGSDPGSAANDGSDAEPGATVPDLLPASEPTGTEEVELPYIFARRTVKADREPLPVYVRPGTAQGVDALERRLDDRFDGDDLMSLDVREALIRAGLRNADDALDVLEAWGYGRR